MDIQVGDKVTYEFDNGNGEKIKRITTIINDDEVFTNDIKILKIERPKYEVVEEKKELLTKEEKEFLKQYIKIIENLNNGKIDKIIRTDENIYVVLETELTYMMEIGDKFGNMKVNIAYTLKELGLEE